MTKEIDLQTLTKQIKYLEKKITKLSENKHTYTNNFDAQENLIKEIKNSKEFRTALELLKKDFEIKNIKLRFTFEPEHEEFWERKDGYITREITKNNISKSKSNRTYNLVKDKNFLGEVKLYEE